MDKSNAIKSNAIFHSKLNGIGEQKSFLKF